MHDDAESELSQRCVEAIAGMGVASTILVNADECSESTVDSVAAQLQAKGWVVEVLPRTVRTRPNS